MMHGGKITSPSPPFYKSTCEFNSTQIITPCLFPAIPALTLRPAAPATSSIPQSQVTGHSVTVVSHMSHISHNHILRFILQLQPFSLLALQSRHLTVLALAPSVLRLSNRIGKSLAATSITSNIFTIRCRSRNTSASMEVDGPSNPADSVEESTLATTVEDRQHVEEGKAIISSGGVKTFYNPTQEVNRDISIVGIQTFVRQECKNITNVNILEAMAATGIRSIRYAKEIDGVDYILANDFSQQAVETLKENCKLNESSKVVPSCEDAALLLLQKRNQFVVVDLDPYGSPVPFLDSALQCIKDGGMLLVTATDMAALAGGNAPESCFSKYGSMSVKSRACHELALRILIFTVQSFANRYGKYVEPLLSLKIDFYVRLFFRVRHSPALSKRSAMQTAMFYQCTGCFSLHFQTLAHQKGETHYVSPRGPPVQTKCKFCGSCFNFGGPIWYGPIHSKTFVKFMEDTVHSEKFSYLGTKRRIEGLLQLVQEELEEPLYYDLSQLCSVLKSTVLPVLTFRSALLNLGYAVSSSHTGPLVFKTNAPVEVVWQVLVSWHQLGNGSQLKPNTPGFNILKYFSDKELCVKFDRHPGANPLSREKGTLRYQVNPSKNWGPGSRHTFDANQVYKAKVKSGRAEPQLSDTDISDPPKKKQNKGNPEAQDS